MTTKTLTGTYAATYTLAAPITTLSITATGKLEAGVTAAASGTYTVVNQGVVYDYLHLNGVSAVTNSGTIGTAAHPGGIYLEAGGSVTNDSSGQISAVSASGVATVRNLGSIGTADPSGWACALYAGGTVDNLGVISAPEFAILTAGFAAITNGSSSDTTAQIDGGVECVAAATVRNFGAMLGNEFGVELLGGGAIINGSASDTSAVISGTRAVSDIGGKTSNYGTIGSTSAVAGVLAGHGALVTNGSATDTQALIEAAYIASAGGYGGSTFRNFGTMRAVGATSNSYPISAGMYFSGGGQVTNGSTADAAALIEGPIGVYAKTDPVTVVNFGSILGTTTSTAFTVGVYLFAGGAVVNGSGTDTGALIEGGNTGVSIVGEAGTVTNFGTILSLGSTLFGVLVFDQGVVTNGSNDDTAAFIDGHLSGVALVSVGTVKNFGTIGGPSDLQGVHLQYGGRVTNGSALDTIALVAGYIGVGSIGLIGTLAPARGTVTNFATIGDPGTLDGIVLGYGGEVTNGSGSDTAARIEARAAGVIVQTNAGTVINFGTIIGDVGPAYGSSLEPGVLFAGGGRVTNGSAADTIALIEGLVGVYAKTDPVTVTNFATISGSGGDAVELTAGGRINAEAGSVFVGTVAAGSAVFDAVAGVTNLAALTAAGMVEGAGTISLNGGASMLSAGASLTASKILVNGGSAEVGGQLADTGDWVQSGATLTVDAGASINFKGAANTFSGTLTGAGAITFSGGADAINDTTLNAATMTVNGAVLTIANVTLTGGGSLTLTNLATNIIKGATASATLTNAGDRITGAGQLGDGRMALINGAGGVIIGNQANALVIDTGASTVINAGVIENTGAGGTTIASLLENDGTLVAAGGTLTVNRAVSGAGTVKVAGGTAHFLAAFSQNVAFGASGVLELDHSRSYAGQVSGFSKSGTTSLDLSDIAFGGATKASYSGTTASGVLTVTDGTHTSKITLLGNYTTSAFTVASDGHGGTTVVDPAAAQLHWLNPVSANFNTPTDWSFGIVPGKLNAAIIDAPGSTAYAVTVLSNETVKSVQTAADATLNVTAGDFTAKSGSGAGIDSGVITVASGATFTTGGTLTSTGTINLAGTLNNSGVIDLDGNGQTQPQNANFVVASNGAVLAGGGTLNLNGSYLGSTSAATLVNVDDTIAGSASDLGGGYLGYGDLTVVNEAKGTIKATGAYGLVLAADTTNDGLIEAAGITVKGGGLVIAGGGGGGTINGSGGGVILAAGSTIYLSGAVIAGGTLKTSGAGRIDVLGNASFDGASGRVSVEGAVVVDPNNVLTLSGEIDLNGGTVTNSGFALINPGLLEGKGSGGYIGSPVDNTGTLEAHGGVLTIAGDVTGSGQAVIAAGTLALTGAFSQNVTFTGSTGVLELGDSQDYAGTIAGFSQAGITSFDLADIGFGGATEASYSGTTASGTLTVTDGTQTSRIALIGNYTASTFTVASDGHGGTSVTDPAAPLVSAMAGFGVRPATGSARLLVRGETIPLLARPA